MKFKNASLIVFAVGTLAVGLSTSASAAKIDTRDAYNPIPHQKNTYWVPTTADKLSKPDYYRKNDQDWGWQHGAISGTFSAASLNISAYDVDVPLGEKDQILAYNSQTKGYESLGFLVGVNDKFSYTTFKLGSSWFDEIAHGLKVKIDIDTTEASWLVSLAKSVLSVDGGKLPPVNPGNYGNPGGGNHGGGNQGGGNQGGGGSVPTPPPANTGQQVPVPAAVWLFGSGLVGLMGLRRKSKLAV